MLMNLILLLIPFVYSQPLQNLPNMEGLLRKHTPEAVRTGASSGQFHAGGRVGQQLSPGSDAELLDVFFF